MGAHTPRSQCQATWWTMTNDSWQRVLVAWALACATVLAGCTVSINKQSAVDPCDPNPCSKVGVCAAWTGTCTAVNGAAVCSDWKPIGTAPKGPDGKTLALPLGYEVSETTCDGQDNDCDGLTDEGVPVPKTVCTSVGVCAGKTVTRATCAAGTWICSWDGVTGYESKEVSCDGLDNDCNGKTDDGVEPGAATCKRAGVCTGLPAPTCSAGAWDCHYSGADYEAAETKCDGKDNDCDGIIDANLSVTTAACKSAGVCATGVQQVCKGGEATCDYSGVTGFEALEQSCDGQDNDCDGVTDNLAGTNLPIQSSDASTCATTGVCAGKSAVIFRRCEAGQFVCDYQAVPFHETPESSCDGRDNDCDGTTDANLLAPATSPCPATGVCGEAKAKCSGGLWSCDWASIPTYEAFEQTCDGKDNDCDGQTDEGTLSPKLAKCKTLGVCAFGAAVTCAAGKATCDYSHIGAFEATETLCDGLDNDCDGSTDEPDSLDPKASGCTAGVCANATAACTSGVWTCNAQALPDWQAIESLCDGKDNDCDGFTDEGAVDPADIGCKALGVCATGTLAACVGAQAICSYDKVPGYEFKEAACDGADNDCDGKTDYNICPPSAACTSDANCTTGSCASVLGGTQKACTVKPAQCAAIGDFSQMVFADDGATRCLTSKSFASCATGKWGTPTVCGASLPVCVDGACVFCTPNELRCDPADATKIQQCSADGKTVAPQGSCAANSHCSGTGVCVSDLSVLVSTTSSGYGGVSVVLGNGNLATAWLNDSGSGATVNVRLFDSAGKALTAAAAVQGNTAAVKGSRLAIAPLGSGFVLAWVTAANGDQDIYVRQFDGAGAPTGAASVASINDTSGDQAEPALASNGTDAYVVAWSSTNIEGSGDGTWGIAAQRFDATGQASADLLLVNDGPDSTNGDQIQPAVAMRQDSAFAVVWTDAVNPIKQRIRGQLFGVTAAPTGSAQNISSGNANSVHPAISLSAKGFAVAWSGSAVDNAGAGIGLRQLDNTFAFSGTQLVANTFTAGDQVDVTLAELASGEVIVGWTSAGIVSAGDGTDIATRTLGIDGTFSGTDTTVTTAESTGDQTNPFVAIFTDGRAAWLFRTKPDANPAQVHLLIP